ncbi:MAG TPA: RNA-guided endonuclease TnpB family protein [Burkholderiaceae bacterium]
MQLTHKIALVPSCAQRDYFCRAAGANRFTWNWALAEWNRQQAAGLKPSAMRLKKQFNAIKYAQFPWLADLHRDSHAQAFAHLARAWDRFFADLKAGARRAPDSREERRRLKQMGVRLAYPPCFKRKGRCADSFYVANDKFKIDGKSIRLPKIGRVEMTEGLRFEGKILGATVTRTADRWFVAIQVEVPEAKAMRPRTGDGIEGVDLGVKAAATLSTGETIDAPKPLHAALRRLKIRGRRLSRKLEAAKVRAGIERGRRIPKGTRVPVSNNRAKGSRALARLHARIANVRADFAHKLTTRLCRENQAVVIEDLHVKGMLANDKLARAISDVGFGMFRRQIEYKAKLFDTRLVLADRWYPSSKSCSACGTKNEALTLNDRSWTCEGCGTSHDRDHNAAINLKRLATVTALPAAKSPSNGGTAAGTVPSVVGEETPARYEFGQQDGSGQEENRAHLCALS